MELSSSQLTALQYAQSILDGAGLSPQDLDNHSNTSSPSPSSRSSPLAASLSPLPSSIPDPSPAILAAQYIPPPACSFTLDEISAGANRLNRQSRVHAIINHPLGAVVEYPQSGSLKGDTVAHIFTLARGFNSSEFDLPQFSFQYSLGDGHGGTKGVQCYLLRDSMGNPVHCNKLSTSCKGLKVCSARPDNFFNTIHSYTNRSQVAELVAPSCLPFEDNAKREVFLKTFAFFCSLLDHGCAFMASCEHIGEDHDDSEGNIAISSTVELVNHDWDAAQDPLPSTNVCRGKLVMRVDKFNRRYIQCQFRSRDDQSHLILHNLQEFDTGYLQALLDDDEVLIASYEEDAKQNGYGPLMPCHFVASPSAQKQLCSHWHRARNRKLARGTLLKWDHQCTAKFDIYTPEDLPSCPQVVVVCRNPHSHPPPAPVKTPPSLINLFRSLLLDMDWQLADATPRRIVLDSGFMKGLRISLGWVSDRSPCLSDIHPSLANLDHVRRLINVFHFEKYPLGTGFEGARLLVDEENKRPQEQRYVRCVETYSLTAKTEFRLVICMTTSMAYRLLGAKRISIDTSFKRLHGWQEFEIEAWDNEHMRSVTGARAFTTSQTAQAHLILFRRIFQIAEEDTGLPVSFYHIHGSGYESIVADGHMGQGLGLGMFCIELCRNNRMFCIYERNRRLCDLEPYDHLRRFYRVCITHFKRNVFALHKYVKSEVYSAMLSLASSEPHPDINKTLAIIRRGGRKAQAWLKDKLETNKFVLAAIYRPASLIPETIWRACPSTTNGNEQAHRSINRDGVNLTLLGGIMRGRDFDDRAARSMDVHTSLGINTRDQDATHVHRATRSIVRQALVQQRRVTAAIPKDAPSRGSGTTEQPISTLIESTQPRCSSLRGHDVNSASTSGENQELTTWHEEPAIYGQSCLVIQQPSGSLQHYDVNSTTSSGEHQRDIQAHQITQPLQAGVVRRFQPQPTYTLECALQFDVAGALEMWPKWTVTIPSPLQMHTHAEGNIPPSRFSTLAGALDDRTPSVDVISAITSIIQTVHTTAPPRSTYSTLQHALTPNANIVDYWPPSEVVNTNSRTDMYRRNSPVLTSGLALHPISIPVSWFSTLAGALGEELVS